MYRKPKNKYEVGDEVRVAGIEQLQKCPFGINDQMEALSGQTVTIKRVEWASYVNTHRYTINEDGGKWAWSRHCFEPVERLLDLPDFEASDISGLF